MSGDSAASPLFGVVLMLPPRSLGRWRRWHGQKHRTRSALPLTRLLCWAEVGVVSSGHSTCFHTVGRKASEGHRTGKPSLPLHPGPLSSPWAPGPAHHTQPAGETWAGCRWGCGEERVTSRPEPWQPLPGAPAAPSPAWVSAFACLLWGHQGQCGASLPAPHRASPICSLSPQPTSSRFASGLCTLTSALFPLGLW